MDKSGIVKKKHYKQLKCSYREVVRVHPLPNPLHKLLYKEDLPLPLRNLLFCPLHQSCGQQDKVEHLPLMIYVCGVVRLELTKQTVKLSPQNRKGHLALVRDPIT